jgi:hypothetical protein
MCHRQRLLASNCSRELAGSPLFRRGSKIGGRQRLPGSVESARSTNSKPKRDRHNGLTAPMCRSREQAVQQRVGALEETEAPSSCWERRPRSRAWRCSSAAVAVVVAVAVAVAVAAQQQQRQQQQHQCSKSKGWLRPQVQAQAQAQAPAPAKAIERRPCAGGYETS